MSLKWEVISLVIIGICMLILFPLGIGRGIAILSGALGYTYWFVLFLPLIILWVVIGLIHFYGDLL